MRNHALNFVKIEPTKTMQGGHDTILQSNEVEFSELLGCNPHFCVERCMSWGTRAFANIGVHANAVKGDCRIRYVNPVQAAEGQRDLFAYADVYTDRCTMCQLVRRLDQFGITGHPAE